MPDDRTDRTEIGGIVTVLIEERVLQDGGGEHDLVEAWVVVRVDGLRGHEPFVAVERFTDLAELAAELEFRGRPNVADQVAGVDRQARVVAPLRRKPDLGRELVELLEGALTGGIRHPGEVRDALAVGLDEVADEDVHLRFRGGREVPGDVGAANGLAEGALHERDAALPAGAHLGGTGEGASVEIEVRLDECARKIGGVRADDLPRHPVAPRVDVIIDEQLGDTRNEARLPHDDLVEDARGCVDCGSPPVETGCERHDIRPGHQVVGGLTVTGLDVVPVGRGDARLEFEHADGAGGSIRQAREAEHRGEVVDILFAYLGELLFAVVRLVGEPESALLDEHQVPVGLARVVVDEQLRKTAHPFSFELPERLEKGLDIRHGCHARQ